MYNVIIIGAGVAGLCAAIYTCRKEMRTAIISEKIGGQLILAERIENFPGFNGSGYDLVQTLKAQATSYGAEIIEGRVERITRQDGLFKTALASGIEYTSETVILAFGKVPRRMGIVGEDKFMGRGVHVCATCDTPLYRDKTAAVIGGGNSALGAVLGLSKIAKKVYMVNRSEKIRGDELILREINQSPNVEILLNSVPLEVSGDRFVRSIEIENTTGKTKRKIEVDGVFVEIGYAINAEIVKELVKLNEKNEIVVDNASRTSFPGVFAAGDVTDTPFKQAVIAAGEGAKAGLSAYSFLHGGKAASDYKHTQFK